MHPTSHGTSQGNANFHGLMKELLAFMQIAHPDTPCEVYRFNFDRRVDVNIFCSRPGAVDFIATPSVLLNRKSDTALLTLLAMNRCTEDETIFNVGIDPISGMITLWSRRHMENLDLEKLTAFLHIVLEKSASVQQELLQCERQTMPRKGWSRAIMLKSSQLPAPR